MKITNLAPEFVKAMPILQKIEDAGYEAYFVGGSVRDTLLHLPIHDVDIASSAYPAEIKAIFPHTIDTGIQHGTVTVMQDKEGYEITTFRTESGYQDFRRPDKVTFVRSLAEDLQRRDFTINALAMRHNGEIIDLFNGLQDLDNKLIRAVGDPNERFHEDALRMMRAVRFEAKLGFRIESNTQAALARHHQLLSKIAVERIHVEFVKMMMGKWRNNGLRSFLDAKLYENCPGFAEHGEDLAAILDVNTMQLPDEATVWTLVAMACHLNVSQTRQLLRQWKSSNELIDVVAAAVNLLTVWQQATPWDYYQAGLLAVNAAINVAKLYQPDLDAQHYLQQYQDLPMHKRSEMAVSGGDLIKQLGLKPGPQVGKLVNEVEKRVVNGQVANDTQAILNDVQQNLLN